MTHPIPDKRDPYFPYQQRSDLVSVTSHGWRDLYIFKGYSGSTPYHQYMITDYHNWSFESGSITTQTFEELAALARGKQ